MRAFDAATQLDLLAELRLLFTAAVGGEAPNIVHFTALEAFIDLSALARLGGQLKFRTVFEKVRLKVEEAIFGSPITSSVPSSLLEAEKIKLFQGSLELYRAKSGESMRGVCFNRYKNFNSEFVLC
jgi:hypothetical protein